ncbi:MAG: CRTAC1 family protein, partial [Thermoanaerobaculia bacterium]
WGDFDNDGDLDLYVANGTEGTDDILGYFYRQLGDGSFERVLESPFDTDRHISAGTAWSDYDNDGDLDIFVANWGDNEEANDLYRNQTSGASWLALRLEGRQSNRMGIGAKVRLVVEMEGETSTQHHWQLLNTGYGSQNAPIIHFGLGDAKVANTLEISWPSGKVDTHSNVEANRFWHAVEGSDLAPDPKKMISVSQAVEAAGLRAGRTPAKSNVNLNGRSH